MLGFNFPKVFLDLAQSKIPFFRIPEHFFPATTGKTCEVAVDVTMLSYFPYHNTGQVFLEPQVV